MAITAAAVGLGETRAGHTLGSGSKASVDSTYGTFDCSCGFRFMAKLRKNDGRAGADAQRTWERHLELADADPDVEFDVGVITIKKGPKRLFVAPRHYRHASRYDQGTNNKNWAAGNYSGGKGWGVFCDASWCKEVLAICDTKEMAFTEALRLMDVAEKRGSKVTRQCDSLSLPDSDTARTVLAALLGLNIAAAGLDEIQLSLAALDEVLSFTQLLEQKRVQLAEARERMLLVPVRRRDPDQAVWDYLDA